MAHLPFGSGVVLRSEYMWMDYTFLLFCGGVYGASDDVLKIGRVDIEGVADGRLRRGAAKRREGDCRLF